MSFEKMGKNSEKLLDNLGFGLLLNGEVRYEDKYLTIDSRRS